MAQSVPNETSARNVGVPIRPTGEPSAPRSQSMTNPSHGARALLEFRLPVLCQLDLEDLSHVKIRRTVTQKMLDANRENSHNSTGPRTETGKKASSASSIKHGLLADGLVFESEEQEEQFAEFTDQLTSDLMPDGALQSIIVEDIGVCYWKLGLALPWEVTAARSRRESSRDVVQGLVAENPQQVAVCC